MFKHTWNTFTQDIGEEHFIVKILLTFTPFINNYKPNLQLQWYTYSYHLRAVVQGFFKGQTLVLKQVLSGTQPTQFRPFFNNC